MPKPSPTKPIPPGREDLPFYVARAAVAFRKLNDCALRQVGMKSQQLGAGTVLHQLFAENSCTVKNLSERTHLPNGTLTGVLDGLERQGLIRRVRNAADGRSWLVQLTRKGKLQQETVTRRHALILGLFNTVLTPAESARLKRDLGRLTTAMNAHVAAQRRPARSGHAEKVAGKSGRRVADRKQS
jgi:DNA-binding MarR family transcriptional regulator